ncbi:MAG TPA: RimK family alpha-L-glutamate ligase [Burkholderiales bacterium]
MSGEIAIIVSDAPGWHGAQLKRALRARGWRARYVSLRACRFDATQGAGVVLPGFGRRLPDGVLVRGIPGGTFEEVTFYLGMLHALRALGVPVYNDARAIERSVDKSTTSFLLRHHGIPTPPAWALTDPAAARALLIAETAHGHELVLKPLFGARGRGLQRLGPGATLPPSEAYAGVYYLQRFVPPAGAVWCDWRVFVIGGEAVAAMRREARDWVTNVARGAQCRQERLCDALAAPACAAAAALGLDHAGVDLMRDADGRYVVIEVNGVPAWKGLQSVCPINIAERLVDDLLGRWFAPVAREAAP